MGHSLGILKLHFERKPGSMAVDHPHRIWRDGKFVDWEDATIHVMSHVVHYGSSVFEGIRCYETPNGPAVFRLGSHMRRFVDSCRIYRMPLMYSIEDLSRAAVETVAENHLPHCYLRPVAIRTGEQMGVLPQDTPLEVFIIPWTWGTYLGADALKNGADVRCREQGVSSSTRIRRRHSSVHRRPDRCPRSTV